MLDDATVSLNKALSFNMTKTDLVIETLEPYYEFFTSVEAENPLWVASCGSIQATVINQADFASIESQILTVAPN